jgi:hypothetical protein
MKIWEYLEKNATELNVSMAVAFMVWSQSGVGPKSIDEGHITLHTFEEMFREAFRKAKNLLPEKMSEKEKEEFFRQLLKA